MCVALYAHLLCDFSAEVPEEYKDQLSVEQLETEATEIETLSKGPSVSTVDFLKDQGPMYALNQENQDFAREHIKNGNTYLNAITHNFLNKIPIKFTLPFQDIQRDYLNAIIAICWALFDRAVTQGNGFTGGTIIFEDKGYKVFNFLFDYAKKANTDLTNNSRDAKFVSQNCFAYERQSSHFPEMQKDFGQYGIDIRFGKGELEKLLPANKSHILFGKVASNNNKDLSFLKMEVYGLCVRDASVIKHGLNFFKGTRGKKGPSRREEVPQEVIALLEKMLSAVPSKTERKVLRDEIGKPVTIKNMYTTAKKIAVQKNNPACNQAQLLVQYLEDTFDHLDIRRGNEVILG